MTSRTLAIAWALSAFVAAPSFAQMDPPSDKEWITLLQDMQKRLDTLEEQHRGDRTMIAELQERVAELEGGSTADRRAAQVEQIKNQLRAELADIGGPSRLFDLSSPAGSGGTLLNPQITVFLETGASISSRGSNNALNRFNLREVELDFRAALSPSVDGVLIIALAEEIESDRNGDVDIDREVDVEEAYINFHTLPHDLSLKVGKFRNTFGRNNLLHTHDLPQVTRPLAIQSFFGPEGIVTVGASLAWLVPNPWYQFVELTVEAVNADGGGESPILGGANAENPAAIAHIKWFGDIGETSSLEIGGSYLYGRTSSNADFDATLFGLDLTYQWVDPDPSAFRSFLVQSELFWARNDVDRGVFRSGRNDSFGAYTFGQYQLGRDWYTGLRADYAEFPNSESRSTKDWDFALSPNLTWYITEFLRLRLEYQHRLFEMDGDSSSEEAVFLQFTGVFGTHPPHPYWVSR